MKDLTQGSIPKHIIEMSVPMAIGMLVQTLYFLVDLYFVGRLGDVAIVQMLTVVLNIILAPILIAGWGTGKPMGVAGAGSASRLRPGFTCDAVNFLACNGRGVLGTCGCRAKFWCKTARACT